MRPYERATVTGKKTRGYLCSSSSLALLGLSVKEKSVPSQKVVVLFLVLRSTILNIIYFGVYFGTINNILYREYLVVHEFQSFPVLVMYQCNLDMTSTSTCGGTRLMYNDVV